MWATKPYKSISEHFEIVSLLCFSKLMFEKSINAHLPGSCLMLGSEWEAGEGVLKLQGIQFLLLMLWMLRPRLTQKWRNWYLPRWCFSVQGFLQSFKKKQYSNAEGWVRMTEDESEWKHVQVFLLIFWLGARLGSLGQIVPFLAIITLHLKWGSDV